MLSYQDYMARGVRFDEQLSAVRMNTDAHDGFSVLWSRLHEKSAKGQVKAIFASTPDIVTAMIEGSIIPQGKPHVATIVEEGDRLQNARR